MINAIRLPRLLQRPLLDVKLGFALMRDRRIPLRSKLTAILLGLAVTGLVEFFELPVEGLLSMLLPVLGALGDFVIDGAELVAGPLLLAAALLPFVAPRQLVDQVRAERATTSPGAPKSPVIDV
jgi:hypothetical protein